MQRGEMLSKMIALAVVAHDGQFDKGGSPYILHPLLVMSFLKEDDEELQCIAVGHDLIEDTNVTYADLRALGMTERIIEAICILTKQRGQTYEEYKREVMTSVDAMKVKLCDLRHNTDVRRLKGVTPKDVERMVRYHNFYMDIRDKLQAV